MGHVREINVFVSFSLIELSDEYFVIYSKSLHSLALTRQIETQEGALVDSSTGKQVSTQAQGTHITAEMNPEFTRRLLMLNGRRLLADSTFDYHEEIRRLTEEVPVATLPDSAELYEQQFHDYEDGVDTVVSVTVDGTIYTGSVGSGATFTPRLSEDGCDVYGNIKEVETAEPIYKVECCGTEQCQAFALTVSSSRRTQTCPPDLETVFCSNGDASTCPSHYPICDPDPYVSLSSHICDLLIVSIMTLKSFYL